MNIFYLHSVPAIAAKMHCDKHVGKMLLESCQLLAACHHHFGHPVTYKATHKNHPSAVWVRESRLHYMYVAELARYLGMEFYKRYSHRHKSETMLFDELISPPAELTNSSWSLPPMAMPDEYKSQDVVTSYRRYYVSKQANFSMVYYRGTQPQPEFFNEYQ